jgi:hypothetical protein
MDPLDLFLDLVIAPGTRRSPAGIRETHGMFVPGGRGDRQFAADRLDTQFPPMGVDERDHHLSWRSSSACAKYADALRRIFLARRSSFTSRSRTFRRSRSSAASAAGPINTSNINLLSKTLAGSRVNADPQRYACTSRTGRSRSARWSAANLSCARDARIMIADTIASIRRGSREWASYRKVSIDL